MGLLVIENLRLEFQTEKGKVSILNGVELSVEEGGIVGLVGESGCGKTLTALALIQLLPPKAKITAGRIWFNGVDLLSYDKTMISRLRGKEIGMIFQDPISSLNPIFTIGNQLIEAIQQHNRSLSKKEVYKEAVRLLEMVKLASPEDLMHRYPHQLSGGMCQRVMIAIALCGQPKILIADEPTTALDVTTASQIRGLLKELQRELGVSILLITHDLSTISDISDKVAVMYMGKIVEYGPMIEIFREPYHPYTSGLLAIITRPADGSRLPFIPGEVPEPGEIPSGCSFRPRCKERISKCEECEEISINQNHYALCWKKEKR